MAPAALAELAALRALRLMVANSLPLLSSVITLPVFLRVVAVKVPGVPLTIAPVCVMVLVPVAVSEAVAVKLRPMVEAAKIKSVVLLIVTSLAPLLDRVTLPVKTLLLSKVMALAPAVKLEVPETLKTPESEMLPVLLRFKLPPD